MSNNPALQEFAQAAAVLAGRQKLLSWAEEVRRVMRANEEDLQFGDYVKLSEDEIYNWLPIYGFNSDTVMIIPLATLPGYEDRHNLRLQADGWHVFYMERGEMGTEGLFATYEQAARFIIHLLYEEGISALSIKYRDKYFPGAILPRHGQQWPDGKIRY
jgi:hypothetical protein